MKLHLTGISLVAALLLTACSGAHKHDHDHDHDHDHHHEHEHSQVNEHQPAAHNEHEHEHEGHDEEIHFSAEQAQAAGLEVETIQEADFYEVIKTSGQIQAAQGDEVTVVATSNGTVWYHNASITEGTAVSKNSAFALLSSKNLIEENAATKAKWNFEVAEKEYLRAQELIKEKVISEKDFDQVCLRYETARSAYQNQAQVISNEGVSLLAPLSGYVKSLLVKQGEYVEVGTPIAILSQNKQLQLKAEVPESYYHSLQQIRTANFKTAYSNTLYKLTELNGRLVSYGKSANQSFYLPITFEFNNIGQFVPGSFAEVYLLTQTKSKVLSVPVSALTEEQGLYFIYLQVHPEDYKKQEVSIGPSNGERVQILSGIEVGSQVVTKGAYRIKLAALAGIIPEGHSHSH